MYESFAVRYVLTLVCCFLILFMAAAHAQVTSANNALLFFSDQEAIPGGTFSLFVMGNVSQPFRGFQVGVRHPLSMKLMNVSLNDTVLAREKNDVFETSSVGQQQLVVRVIQDDEVPLTDVIQPDLDVKLVRLDFKLDVGVELGTNLEVELTSDVGTPPVPALVFSGEESIAAELSPGVVSVVNNNVLRILNTDGIRLGRTATVRITAFNLIPLQGFSIAAKFDPSCIRVLGAGLEGTLTEAVGAEYFAPVIDNVQGTLALGVLIDALPPYENQTIPAAGFEVPLANVEVETLKLPEGIEAAFDFSFAEEAGNPPIQNLLIVDNYAIKPETQNGRLSFIFDDLFLRGDVNEDGVLDISDPIALLQWVLLSRFFPPSGCEKVGDADDSGVVETQDAFYLLFYLFRGGPIVPTPFPFVGFDPTPDDLFCYISAE